MRYQGKISTWNAERGFGFIVWNGGGEKIFVHVSQLSHKKHVPVVGEVVTYELGPKDDKGQKAIKVIFPDLPALQKKRREKEKDNSSGLVAVVLFMLIVAGLYWWLGIRHSGSGTIVQSVQADKLLRASKPIPATSRFSCEGKTRCPQMASCEEATFYIQHCPNTEMDGDGDGVPCESQWCK